MILTNLLLFFVLPYCTLALMASPPITTYFDGSDSLNQCASRLERRITGSSGIIYSHSLYGREPYNASRNCFMMLVVPAGYRIRLKVLEFDVNGHISNCDKDTLHVFDHEQSFDPSVSYTASLDDVNTPGPIMGQFCGRIQNKSEISSSTHNAITLWWHSNPIHPEKHRAMGFKLHWSAFREVAKTGQCASNREFPCGTTECIPIELACDHFADCKDASDTTMKSRTMAKCENIDLDPIVALSGGYLLLVSGSLVVSSLCLCVAICLCCKGYKTTPPSNTKCIEQGEAVRRESPPNPPQFYPPSPPKMLMQPNNQVGYTPRRLLNFDPVKHNEYRTVRVLDPKSYESSVDNQNEYTYVRNDVQSHLI